MTAMVSQNWGLKYKSTGLNWTLFAVTGLQQKRIACNTSQPGIGTSFGSHESVMNPLDTLRHQRFSGVAKPPGRKADSSLLA